MRVFEVRASLEHWLRIGASQCWQEALELPESMGKAAARVCQQAVQLEQAELSAQLPHAGLTRLGDRDEACRYRQ